MKNRQVKQLMNVLDICLERLQQYRGATIITVLLLTTTLCLPALFWSVTANLSKLSHRSYNSMEMSVYLKKEASAVQIKELSTQLKKMPTVAGVQVITPEDGLQSMSQDANLSLLLKALPSNPLPTVITVDLKTSDQLEANAKDLKAQLLAVNIVDTVQLDSLWLQRLNIILSTLKELSLVLGILLGIGVILIVSNSIQLTLERHRHEIAIYQLVGANSLFIRAPFLVAGLLIGLASGVLTWIIVSLIISWLSHNVSALASLYQSDFQITHFGFLQGLILLAVSSLLGTVGATIASRDYG